MRRKILLIATTALLFSSGCHTATRLNGVIEVPSRVTWYNPLQIQKVGAKDGNTYFKPKASGRGEVSYVKKGVYHFKTYTILDH